MYDRNSSKNNKIIRYPITICPNRLKCKHHRPVKRSQHDVSRPKQTTDSNTTEAGGLGVSVDIDVDVSETIP